MTSYWPTAAIMQHLKPTQVADLMRAERGIPMLTMRACHNVTSKVAADTTLALVCSEGVNVHRVYLQYPSFEQWVALERSGFVELWDEFGFIMDALH